MIRFLFLTPFKTLAAAFWTSCNLSILFLGSRVKRASQWTSGRCVALILCFSCFIHEKAWINNSRCFVIVAEFQRLTMTLVSVVLKYRPLKEIHVYSLVIQKMRKWNRLLFFFLFFWLLQLLTQKVKLFEPNKTILSLIQLQLKEVNYLFFLSVQKSSDRIKLDRAALEPNQTVCVESWACLFFREEASKPKSPSRKVWETQAKRGNTGNLVIALFIYSCQILKVAKQRKHMGAEHVVSVITSPTWDQQNTVDAACGCLCRARIVSCR